MVGRRCQREVEGTHGAFKCAAKLCDEEVRREGFYCKKHWEHKHYAGDNKRQVTWDNESSQKWKKSSRPKGKGAKGRDRKGKGDQKGKGKGKVKITTSDANDKVSSYYVDAYTLETIAKIK